MSIAVIKAQVNRLKLVSLDPFVSNVISRTSHSTQGGATCSPGPVHGAEAVTVAAQVREKQEKYVSQEGHYPIK